MQLAPHKHPWGQLVFGTRGVMTVHTDGATWLAPATRAIWMPADIAHEIVMKGEVAMRTLYIAPERAVPLPATPRVIEIAPFLRELILHILGVGMLDPARPDHDRLAGLLIDLLVQARAQDLMLPLPRDKRAQTLAEHLQTRPGDRASLADLAQQAGASLRTLQRLFPEETGLTVEAWRQKARLIWAVAQLSAGASVTASALDCGYESPSAFITAFKRQFGVTPSSYRQR
ncbi:MAG TPA: helix-turn-helix transcriptional regulator [Caulobacteraceae bacterium]